MRNLSTRIFITIISLCCCLYQADAQILYARVVIFINAMPVSFLYKIDAATCEKCPIRVYPSASAAPIEVLMLPNGLFMESYINSGETQFFNLPDPNPVSSVPGTFYGAVVSPGGTIYFSNFTGLYTYDPVNNTTSFIGPWPVLGPQFLVLDLFYFNNQLYAEYQENGNAGFIQVDTVNPLLSTEITINGGMVATGSAPGTAVYLTSSFSGLDNLYTFDPVTNSLSFICDLMFPSSSVILSLTVSPLDVPEVPCTCFADAGTAQQVPYTVCEGSSATIAFFNDFQTGQNDIVRYILFTDPADPAGSILLTRNNPSFPFQPPLQVGVTYYVARVVGENLNGNINYANPCIDFSNIVEVTWRAKPTVTLTSLLPADLCSGQCGTATVEFTGVPPFTINWRLQTGNTALTSLSSVTLPSSPATFEVCVPANVIGPVNVVVCSMTDAGCANP